MIEFPRAALPAKAGGAVFAPARTAVVEWCSPKSFRVEAGLAWLAERAFTGAKEANFWWVGPSYGAAMGSLGIFKAAMTPGSYTPVPRASALVLINGATIWFKSAESPMGLYSDSVSAAVIDNAVQIPEKAWLALRETLANTRAPARIISTVAGKENWFHELARRAESEPTAELSYARFSARDAISEGILNLADLDYARATLPDHIFRAMYLCEPYDDRVEAAHRAADPRLMSDEELAIIAGLDPSVIAETSDQELRALVAIPSTL